MAESQSMTSAEVVAEALIDEHPGFLWESVDGGRRDLRPDRRRQGEVAKVIGSPWQRCTVHFIRNMHGHCKAGRRNMVSAALRGLRREDLEDARERSTPVVERLTPVAPKVAELLTEEDLLALYRFPTAHWPKSCSTDNLEQVNKAIARRSDIVGIFPNDLAVIRLVGALSIEQNDEWLLARGRLSKESIALVLEDQGESHSVVGWSVLYAAFIMVMSVGVALWDAAANRLCDIPPGMWYSYCLLPTHLLWMESEC